MRIVHYLSKNLFYVTGIIFFILLSVDPLDLESTRRWAWWIVTDMGAMLLFGWIMVKTEHSLDRRYNAN
jgi:bacteriorhodopsin